MRGKMVEKKKSKLRTVKLSSEKSHLTIWMIEYHKKIKKICDILIKL